MLPSLPVFYTQTVTTAPWAQESNLAQFSEEAVHGHLFKTGLTDLVDETAAIDEKPVATRTTSNSGESSKRGP